MCGTGRWRGFEHGVKHSCCISKYGSWELGVGVGGRHPEPRTPNPEAERGGVAGPGPKPMSPLLLPA